MTWSCNSPYSHLAWLGTWRTVGKNGEVITVHMRRITDCLLYVNHGRADVRWVHRGRERRFVVDAGTVRVTPADDEEQTLIATCEPGLSFYTLLIPRGHVAAVLQSEGVNSTVEREHVVTRHDPVLTSCVERLSGLGPVEDDANVTERDEAARALAFRLALILGGRGRPTWHRDSSVFDARTMRYLVRHVDQQLRIAPSLSDMALLVGLSPGHFARKFRSSTGLSLYRFVNRRRILASLEMLKDQSQPLAHVAFDLGFSSQSHFTRLFSETTGMTPAKYRKQFRQTECSRLDARDRHLTGRREAIAGTARLRPDDATVRERRRSSRP